MVQEGMLSSSSGKEIGGDLLVVAASIEELDKPKGKYAWAPT